MIFRLLGVLALLFLFVMFLGWYISTSVIAPRRRRKHIQELEEENDRLDQIITIRPRDWRR